MNGASRPLGDVLAGFKTPQVFWGQGCAEPTPLIDSFLDTVNAAHPAAVFAGVSFHPRLATPVDGLQVVSYGALGVLRRAAAKGALDVVPCNYSNLPRLFRERRLPGDIALVQLSPPDANGNCTLGIGVDYVADALIHASHVIGEINVQMPTTRGGPLVPLDRLDAYIETDRPLVEAPERAANQAEQAIAMHVAELVPDGATLQFGVGPVPSEVIRRLTSHRNLGVHSGQITDAVLDLVASGALTGAQKERDQGMIVTGTVIGSSALFDAVATLNVAFRPVSYTHSPAVLSHFRRLVSVNSAVEVDLSGQVNAEVRQGQYVGGVGGQLDFTRAASQNGELSIITLRATEAGVSTIVPQLTAAVVTSPRADVDAVVTEHGVAWLRGQTLRQRAHALVAIADPSVRDKLDQHARSI
ncbi:MAG: acetyl-CoA hydrolase/transferase C-terminal domain-containing protein [Nitriliruptoraceae bacterium]